MEDKDADRLLGKRTARYGIQNGELVYKQPSLFEIKRYCAEQTETLWDEVKRFENPHTYYVDLSKKLWDIKNALLEKSKDGKDLK